MALLTYGGVLLSPLTEDPNCCCGPPEDCEDCCLKITSGTLIGGAIKIFVVDGDYAMEVTIATPSGTRLVCDQDEITIAIEFTAPPEADAESPDAVATWDAIWRHVTSTPSPAGTGSINNYGHINWGNLGTRSYSVTLKLHVCHLKNDPTLGLITVGSLEWPLLTSDIEILACNVVPCCYKDIPCETCCYYLEEGWIWNDTQGWWEKLFSGGDFDLLVTIEMGDPPLACVDLDEVIITLHVVTKDKATNTAALFNTVITTENWPLREPAGDDPERPVGFKGDVIWTGASSKSYQIKIAPTCDELLGADASISWTIEKAGGAAGFGDSASWIKCGDLEGCECCCPDHCCGDCHFPVTEDACEVLDPVYGYNDFGGPTQIVNLIATVTVTPDAFCPVYDEFGFTGVYEGDTATYEQQDLSVHNVVCTNVCPTGTPKICPSSACSFSVIAKETTCTYSPEAIEFGEGLPFPLSVVYNGAGDWGIGSGGAGWIYWVTGRTSYSGDCNGATASGTFTSGPYTYNWTTSFTVTRTMPDPAPTCPLPEAP